MIEPVSVPILLDLELSDEEYNIEVEDDSSDYSMEFDTSIIVNKVSGHGLPPGGVYGDLIMKSSSEDYAVEWITPASSAEEDNTKPITAAAVYTEIGNINALLATI